MEKRMDFEYFLEQFFTPHEIKKITPIFYITLKIMMCKYLSFILKKYNNTEKKDYITALNNILLLNRPFEFNSFRIQEKELNKFIEDSFEIPNSILYRLNVPNNYNIDIIGNHGNILGNISKFFCALIEDRDLFSFSSPIKEFLLGHVYEKYIITDEKSKGAYYTPSLISKYICSDILSNKNRDFLSTIKNSNINGIKKSNISKYKNDSAIKILDPACGTGIFLVESFRLLCAKYSFSEKETVSKNGKSGISKLFNILNSLNGIDTDSAAVSITKVNLWLNFLSEYSKLFEKIDLKVLTRSIFKILNENIISNDFLTDNITLESKFDIILGNPPYISSKEMDSSFKKRLKIIYKTAVKQFDMYTIFIEKSYQLLKPGGDFGFIIPDSLLGRSHFEDIRKHILENTCIRKIDQINGVFNNPNVSNIILFFRKIIADNKIQFNRYKDLNSFSNMEGESISIPQSYCLGLEQSKILFIDRSRRIIISKILKISQKLEDFIIVHRGEEIGKNSMIISKTEKNNSMKLLFGENVKRYSIDFLKNYISIDDILKKSNFALYRTPKILIRQLGNEINATFDSNGEFVTLQTVYNVILNSQDIMYEYLLGILNSKLMDFYYKTMFQEKMLFPRILLENIKKIPIMVSDKITQSKIAELVSKIIGLKKMDNNSLSFEKKIDDLVFAIYNISDTEKKIILGL